jgi:hypothetical protein
MNTQLVVRWLMAMAAGWSCVCAAQDAPRGKKVAVMKITSVAFTEGRAIPVKYTCSGADSSPPLKWSGAPPGTKSFALIADDPDAPGGTWTHWVVCDMPAVVKELAEDTPKSQFLGNGGRQGMNDFHRPGYGGPCPPPGKAHRYFFKIYALDTMLGLPTGANKQDVLSRMQGHLLAQGQIMGTFERK